MKQITAKEAAELLFDVAKRILVKDKKVYCKFPPTTPYEVIAEETEKYSEAIDNVLIDISFAKTEEEMKGILNNLTDDIFIALVLRWCINSRNLMNSPSTSFFSIPDHEDPTGPLIRLVLVNEKSRIAGLYRLW